MTEPTSLDFRAVFEACPGAYLLLSPTLEIVGVSEGYLHATMTTREELVGKPLFEAFPDNPDDPTASGTTNLRASLDIVLGERRAHEMGIQKYDIRRPASEGGGFEPRYWSPVNVPVLGPDGEVKVIIHRVEDVTDKVRLEKQDRDHDAAIRELSRSDELSRLLLDSAPDAMVVVNDAGVITLVNLQTERMFGYPRAELIGQSMHMLIPERLRESHKRHVSSFFTAPKTRYMGSGLELFGRTKDGRDIPIEVSLSPLQTAHGWSVSAAIRDVTDRRQMETLTKISADRLASAFESTEEALALFDGADRLVLCNSVYRRLLTDSLAGPLIDRDYLELLDAWIQTLVFADDAERDRFRADRIAARARPTAAFEVRTRDGRSLRVKERRTPEGGMLETIWDLTDDVRREGELRDARAAADVASAAKSEFLSSMSHELRTPLNAVLGFAQLLQRDKKEPLSTRHQERVQQILKGGEHLLRLIDDILDLSRIEAGGVSISTEPVGVLPVLQEIRSTLEPAAARASVHIDIAPLPNDLPMVSVDRTRFAQILMNYGSNAIKYNRAGGKVVFSVSVTSRDKVRVSVLDTGWGIPVDKQEKLFQPFQRAGQETGPIEGTGIGLTITKRLAELMKGDVGFRSAPSEGSEFWVEMPVHGKPGEEAPRTSTKAPTSRLDQADRGIVLYVEDNPANVTFMRDLLEVFEGIELLVAPTAEIGIEMARHHTPDVIIMDINLPGMSGVDALHMLQRIDATRSIPVIALTAAASERDRERGEKAGFYRYLTKPVNVAELEAALEAHLTQP